MQLDLGDSPIVRDPEYQFAMRVTVTQGEGREYRCVVRWKSLEPSDVREVAEWQVSQMRQELGEMCSLTAEDLAEKLHQKMLQITQEGFK